MLTHKVIVEIRTDWLLLRKFSQHDSEAMFYGWMNDERVAKYTSGMHIPTSRLLDDNGFTLISNEIEPFFSVFPQPEEDFKHFLNDREELQKTFATLSHTDR